MGTWLASRMSRGPSGSVGFHPRTSVGKFTRLGTYKVSRLLGETQGTVIRATGFLVGSPSGDDSPALTGSDETP